MTYDPFREFRYCARASTEKFLSDYQDEHHDDDPAVVAAYCAGFREACELISAVVIAHFGRR